MRRFHIAVSVFVVSVSQCLLGQSSRPLAITPPLGWNSWDSYGLTITEPQFKANVDWMSQHLKRYGWQYAVIDEGWYLSDPASGGKPAWHYTISGNGLYFPAVDRFPSAANDVGFKAEADYVHKAGLKFGFHIIRGIPRVAAEENLPIAGSSYHAAEAADYTDTCAWNPDNYGVRANEAGQAYYDSMAKLYAGWGVDFIKVDCISNPYKDDEIHMIARALQKSGRPIVLSLSPGPTPIEKAGDVRNYAQMWRISQDFWDTWDHDPKVDWSQGLRAQFDLIGAWAKYTERGGWPDADMLPIGHLGPHPGLKSERVTRLTNDEARTAVTLWSIARSPLMIGSNLPMMNSFTESLLTNPEVLAVDQHSSGNHPALTTPTTVVWLAQPQRRAGYYLGVFNIGEAPEVITSSWKELGIADKDYQVRDLWKRKSIGSESSLRVTLKPHACVLYRLTKNHD